MESESSFIFKLFVSWGPIILLVVIWGIFMKKSGANDYKNYMKHTTEKLNEQVEETKRLNNNIEKIYEIIKERNR